MESSELAAALKERFPRARSALLPALHYIQEELGWVPDWALLALSQHIHTPKSEVYGAVTSYPEFRPRPPAERTVRVCTGLSCRLRGADALLSAALEALGVAEGGLPPDSSSEVEEVPCFFACGVAPLVEVDGRRVGRCDPAALTATLAGEPAAAARPLRPGAARAVLRLEVADSSCGRAAGGPGLVEAARASLTRRAVPATAVPVGCDGACFEAPAVTVHYADGTHRRYVRVTRQTLDDVLDAALWSDESPASEPDFLERQDRLVAERIGRIDPTRIDEAIAAGSYAALRRAIVDLGPEGIIARVGEGGLTGRGGAYFPTARKWEAVRGFPPPRFLVVNAEEGEPGVFKDRHLMEGDPHRVLEGALLAAFAADCERGYIYVNGEARLSAERMELALRQAREAGLLGSHILGSGFSFTVEVIHGAGGYVCGEETALLNTMEGQRRIPRPRPPYPTEQGLFGRPTVINNVETLAAVPLILTDHRFAQLGTEGARGTKIISLSGAVRRPGLVEVAMGTPLRRVVCDIGGGPPTGRRIVALSAGGPSGVLLPPAALDGDSPPEAPRHVNPSLGAGGLVALHDGYSIGEAVELLVAYNAAESCGHCTPCREGTPRLREALRRLRNDGTSADVEEARELVEVMTEASMCGLGQMAGRSVASALTYFPDEVVAPERGG